MSPFPNQADKSLAAVKSQTKDSEPTHDFPLTLIMPKVYSYIKSGASRFSFAKRKFVLCSILFLLISLGLNKMYNQRKYQKTLPPLSLKTFAIGKVQPIGYIRSITLPMIYSSSRIRKLYVEENDYVREGKPLFTVEDSKDALINMESSKANLDQKKAELNSSESKLLSAKSLRDFYKSQYKRYQFLANSGAATLEQAQQQLTLYRAAEQDYLSNLEQVKANKAALASARWVYRSNKFKSDISTVRAPADVRVFKVYARTGEGVRDGKPVMDVGESQNMGILAEVYRIDINKIRLNQKASITVNGMPMIRWAGKVIQISTQATQQSINSDDPATAMANRVFNVLIKLSPVSSSEAKNFNYMEVNVVFDR